MMRSRVARTMFLVFWHRQRLVKKIVFHLYAAAPGDAKLVRRGGRGGQASEAATDRVYQASAGEQRLGNTAMIH